MEVHAFLGESSSLIEAAEVSHSSIDHLILLDAKNLLPLQPLDGVDDAEGHADGEGRSNSDGDEAEESIDQVKRQSVLADNEADGYGYNHDDDQHN